MSDMALCKSAVASFIFLMALCEVSMGAVHKVGDSAGWTTIGHIDYMKWASTKTFKVGDIIVFEYHKQIHNVLQVTYPAFQSCNTTAPLVTYTSGNDSITIKSPGHFFFLCGIPGHCEVGQKVDIRVLKTSSSAIPSLAPAKAPYGSSPSPPSLSPAPSPGPSSSIATSIHSSMGIYASKLVFSVVLAFCMNGFAY